MNGDMKTQNTSYKKNNIKIIEATFKLGSLTNDKAVRAKDTARRSVRIQKNVRIQAVTIPIDRITETIPLTVTGPIHLTSHHFTKNPPIFVKILSIKG
jgi:hypothetical protein